MSKENLTFNDPTICTCLQGNKISVTFAMVKDDSVPYGYANKYRFRYQYCRIYCDIENNDDYAYYDGSTWTTLSAWTPVEFSFEPGDTDANRSIEIIPPHLDFDAVFRLEVQVYNDGKGTYYDSKQGSYTLPFIAFYNRTASLQLTHAVHVNDKEIELEGAVIDTGLFHPANYNEENIENSTAWQKYCQKLWECFFDTSNANANFIELSGAASLYSNMSNQKNQIIDTFTHANIYKWHTGTFKYTISVEDPMFKDLSTQANIYIQLSFEYNAYTSIDPTFKLASDDTDKTYKTNIVLLPAPIASFQIKRRAIKAQMLEDDTIIGTYSTGAGMFNHGEGVGVDVSGETPNLDNSKGHSIALYDTRADGDHASNKPSIGFMNDQHQTMGYLKYGVASDGRSALLSNLPIIGNNQEVDDDPTVIYNMSIDLILDNNEVKTISFNGELS